VTEDWRGADLVDRSGADRAGALRCGKKSPRSRSAPLEAARAHFHEFAPELVSAFEISLTW